MADKAAKPTLGSFANLPGSPLEDIAEQEVEVAKLEFSTRRLRDNPEAPFVVITLTDGSQYHSWSAFLIEKLEQVPGDALPASTTFRQIETAQKRKVWTLE